MATLTQPVEGNNRKASSNSVTTIELAESIASDVGDSGVQELEAKKVVLEHADEHNIMGQGPGLVFLLPGEVSRGILGKIDHITALFSLYA